MLYPIKEINQKGVEHVIQTWNKTKGITEMMVNKSQKHNHARAL